jgi:hypothetical protein
MLGKAISEALARTDAKYAIADRFDSKPPFHDLEGSAQPCVP